MDCPYCDAEIPIENVGVCLLEGGTNEVMCHICGLIFGVVPREEDDE